MTEESRIVEALDAIKKRIDGPKALEVLYIITYFAPGNINVEMFSSLVKNGTELGSAVRLLIQHSIVDLNQAKKVLNIDKKIQKILATILDRKNKKLLFLYKALELFYNSRINARNLDHAMSVWGYVAPYPQLIENFCLLPSGIVDELKHQIRFQEAEAFGWKALDLLKKTIGESHQGTSTLQHNIGMLLGLAGKPKQALEILLPLYERNITNSAKRELRDTLITIARQLGEMCRFDEALKIYNQTLFRNEKISQANDDMMLSAWHDYAHILCETEKYSEASAILKEILNRRNQILDDEDGDTLSLQSSLAHVLVKEGKYSEALKIFQQVFEGRKIIFGEDHIITSRSRRDIALVFANQGKCDEALAIYEGVTESFKQVLGNDHPDTMSIQADVAALFQQRGEFQKALDTYRSIYKHQSEILGEKHTDPLRVKYHIATILFVQEQHDEALKTLQEVLEAYNEVFGPNHPKTLELAVTLETLNNVSFETVFSAAREGNLSKIKSMFQSGGDINNTDVHRKTTLHYAAEYGHMNVVKFLLKKGAIYNTKSKEHKTPLQLAEKSEIKSLLNSVANLIKVVKEGNYDEVSKIIAKNKGFLNAKDNDGSNSLHWAAHNGRHDIVKLLLQGGADATQVTNKGNTPLHIATSKGHKDIVEILLQSISHDKLNNFIDAKTTGGGVTSVHVAVKNGSIEIVKTLLQHGAVYNVKNKLGKTPLELSKDKNITSLLKLVDKLFQNAKIGDPEIISRLEDLEVDELLALTSTRNIQGNTILQVLVTNKHENVASQLSELLIKSNQSESPFDSEFNDLVKLKQATESHLKFSIMHFSLVKSKLYPYMSGKNSCPWFTLKEGSYYLRNVLWLVEVYEKLNLSPIHDNNLESVKGMLMALEFDPKHITLDLKETTPDGEVHRFISKGQGKMYHDFLYSDSKEHIRLFLEMVELNIYIPVRIIFDSLKSKLQSLLSERLFEAVKNNNSSDVENFIETGKELDLTKIYTEKATRTSHADHITLIDRLLSDSPFRVPITTKDKVELDKATCKRLEGIFPVLLQHVTNEKLNDLINVQAATVEGETLLHVAVKNGYFDIVKLLFNHGVIYNFKDKEGKVPLDISQDDNITNLLKLIDELFNDAINGNIEIISKLRNIEPDLFSAVTNACNDQGNTLLHAIITNKYKNIESKFIELFKKSDEIHSSAHLNCGLSKLEDLENCAKKFTHFSLTYIRKTQQAISRSNNLYKKSPSPWNILEQTTIHLSNAYRLVELYKNHVQGPINDANINSVNDTLIELEFHPKHKSVGYIDDGHGEKSEYFVSTGQGKKYYKLLQSKSNKDIKSFMKIVERGIDVPIKKFFILVKDKIQSGLFQKLLKAIESNNFTEVEDCISRGVDVNSADNNGGTPLHFAVNNGSINIVNILLKNGAYPNQVTTKGNTPLHIATSKGNKEIVEILLRKACCYKLNEFVNAQTVVGGTTSLHVAAKNDSRNVVKLLLTYGAIYCIENKEGKLPFELSQDENIIKLLKLIDILFENANNGDVEMMKELENLEDDGFLALLNACNDRGDTVLEIAIPNRYKNSKSRFVELFKKPNQLKSLPKPKSKLEELEMLKEVTELHIETSKLYMLCIKSLTQARKSANLIAVKNGSFYLQNVHSLVQIYKSYSVNGSIEKNDIEALNESLVGLEFDPNHLASYTDEVYKSEIESFRSKGQKSTYYNLLHNTSKSFINIIETDIEIKVTNILDSIKQKLHILLSEKLSKITERNGNSEIDNHNCVRGESGLNAKTTDGRTPLHYAVNNGDLGITSVLLTSGADATLVTTKGDTPLHIATLKDFKELVELLLDHVGQDKLKDFINAQTAGGMTSLHIAAKNGCLDIVKSLLKRGATYNIQNTEGEIPLDLSTDRNVTNLLKLTGEIFQEARNCSSGIIVKLQRAESDELVAITNACNTHGNTLWQIILSNKDENVARKYLEFLKKPDNIQSTRLLPDPKLLLDEIERFKEAAESCVRSSELFLPMLRRTSQSNRSEKNSFPWTTLKAGSFYLQSVYRLVQVCKKCTSDRIEDENINAVNDILSELEFDPKHITTGYTDEAYDGKVECFVSKGQGTRYYELLHSELKKDVRTFVELIDPEIDICVKNFLHIIDEKFRSLLSVILFQAVENNNNSEVRYCCTREKLIVNSKSVDGRSPLHYAVSNGNLGIINILLKNGANVTKISDDGETVLHVASSKGQKKIIEVLFQYVQAGNDKFNEFINAQTIIRGNTSLHIAAKTGSLDVVETLLKQGAIYNIKNKDGKKAIDLSRDENVTNLLKLIESSFSDAKNGNSKIIRKLKTQPFKFTAIMNTRNEQGRSLSEVAIFNKHQCLADKLQMIKKK